MKVHLLTAVLILAAIVLEMAGYGKPGSNWGATLFVAGLACEFSFWIRVGAVRKARRHRVSITQKYEPPDSGPSRPAPAATSLDLDPPHR